MTKACKSSSKANNSKEKILAKKTSASPKSKGDNGSKIKKISFSYFDPEAHQVSLAGNFNNWSFESCMLKRKDTGEWNTTLTLEPGTYEYRFIVDGQWRDDPKALERIQNPYGSFNCRINVK